MGIRPSASDASLGVRRVWGGGWGGQKMLRAMLWQLMGTVQAQDLLVSRDQRCSSNTHTVDDFLCSSDRFL